MGAPWRCRAFDVVPAAAGGRERAKGARDARDDGIAAQAAKVCGITIANGLLDARIGRPKAGLPFARPQPGQCTA
jgi:hypothetical protein